MAACFSQYRYWGFCGFLGIGGGLLRLPALIYLCGCPTQIAVGTNLFEVPVSGTYGGVTYSLKGFVDYNIALLIMLAGGGLGSYIGADATRYLSTSMFRICFFACGMTVLIHLVLKPFFIGAATMLIFFMPCVIFIGYCVKKHRYRHRKNSDISSITV